MTPLLYGHEKMTYEYLQNLKKHHITLKLINSDNAAFSLAFFDFVFNRQRFLSIEAHAIEELLETFQADLTIAYENRFPKEAKAYLEDWTLSGYLKKYYNAQGEVV